MERKMKPCIINENVKKINRDNTVYRSLPLQKWKTSEPTFFYKSENTFRLVCIIMFVEFKLFRD